jgi:signal peptidase II
MADQLRSVLSRLAALPPRATGLAIAGTVLVLDQVSKWWVLNGLQLSPPGCLAFNRAADPVADGLFNTCRHIEMSSIFDITMVWNKGVSFGLLGADNDVGRWLLVVFSLLISAGLIAGLFGYGPVKLGEPANWRTAKAFGVFEPNRGKLLYAIGFGFVIGGALGNAIDRALFGAVVDFLNFSGLHFPWVFNIADVSINLGVAAIVLDVFFGDHPDQSKS